MFYDLEDFVDRFVSTPGNIGLITYENKAAQQSFINRFESLLSDIGDDEKYAFVRIDASIFSGDEFHEEILMGCRMLAELGADCIKTFYTNKFREVTSKCPVPILGLGAEKTPTDRDALVLAEKEMKDGAGGVVFGRK